MSTSTVKYPGFGLQVNEEGPPDRFPNAIKDWAGMPITVRERTMMFIMNSITDKPDWDRKVFDDNVTQKWRQEALDAPDMDVTVKMLDYVSGFKVSHWSPSAQKKMIISKSFVLTGSGLYIMLAVYVDSHRTFCGECLRLNASLYRW